MRERTLSLSFLFFFGGHYQFSVDFGFLFR